jgi:hypothetical protein
LISGSASLACATSAYAKDKAPPPIIRNYTAPGNLESNNDLGCIAMSEVVPAYNPVDLFKAANACVTREQYEQAVGLRLFALAFGRFDAMRVADTTAHQAVTVASMEVFGGLSTAQTGKFDEATKTAIGSANFKTAFCAELRRVGPPAYHPRYMIQHGMGAFTGRGGDGLVPNFDASKAWEETLATYIKCAPRGG